MPSVPQETEQLDHIVHSEYEQFMAAGAGVGTGSFVGFGGTYVSSSEFTLNLSKAGSFGRYVELLVTGLGTYAFSLMQ
jgi:hypothetical protein